MSGPAGETSGLVGPVAVPCRVLPARGGRNVGSGRASGSGSVAGTLGSCVVFKGYRASGKADVKIRTNGEYLKPYSSTEGSLNSITSE